MVNILKISGKEDLLRVLNWIDNKDNKENMWIEFNQNGKKYKILIPSYGMTWRLFDFPYTHDSDKHRRIMTQKSTIIDFIEEK